LTTCVIFSASRKAAARVSCHSGRLSAYPM
jgi:hypothetical protein